MAILIPRIAELSLQNIRCFHDVQRARLARITLLVGENSVGKSTFLGCYSAFAHLSNLVDLIDSHPFDRHPFSMGDYDTIARSGAASFEISGRYDNHAHSTAHFSFCRDKQGRPLERSAGFSFVKGDSPSRIKISAGANNDRQKEQISFQGPNFEFGMDWAEISFIPISNWLSRNVRQGFLPYNGDSTIFRKRRGVVSNRSKELVEFNKFVNFFRTEMPLPVQPSFRVKALGPDGFRRQRSYSEPPAYLVDCAERLRITQVGKKLGLWNDIALNRSALDDQTEVRAKTDFGFHNLFDVGYGVHSMLPLVHAMVTSDSPSMFLLQQPEVHVHPVAQAKLAQYMAEGTHDYIIETHSDHIIDRFRLCVLQKVLEPSDLAILYFEKKEDGSQAIIHNISVDAQGNIIDVPENYREFFLKETEQLLGF